MQDGIGELTIRLIGIIVVDETGGFGNGLRSVGAFGRQLGAQGLPHSFEVFPVGFCGLLAGQFVQLIGCEVGAVRKIDQTIVVVGNAGVTGVGLLPTKGSLTIGNHSRYAVNIESLSHGQMLIPLQLMRRYPAVVGSEAIAVVLPPFIPAEDVTVADTAVVGCLHRKHPVVQEDVGVGADIQVWIAVVGVDLHQVCAVWQVIGRLRHDTLATAEMGKAIFIAIAIRICPKMAFSFPTVVAIFELWVHKLDLVAWPQLWFFHETDGRNAGRCPILIIELMESERQGEVSLLHRLGAQGIEIGATLVDGKGSIGHYCTVSILQTEVDGLVARTFGCLHVEVVEFDVLKVVEAVGQLIAVIHILHTICGEVLTGTAACNTTLRQVKWIVDRGGDDYVGSTCHCRQEHRYEQEQSCQICNCFHTLLYFCLAVIYSSGLNSCGLVNLFQRVFFLVRKVTKNQQETGHTSRTF